MHMLRQEHACDGECQRHIQKLRADYDERQQTVEWWVKEDLRLREALQDIISLLAPAPDHPRIVAARQRASDVLHPLPMRTRVLDPVQVQSLFAPLTPERTQAILAQMAQRA